MTSATLASAASQGSLDLGVSFHPPQRTELEALPLFDERMMLLVNPSHPLAGRAALAFAGAVLLAFLPSAVIGFLTIKLIKSVYQLRIEFDRLFAIGVTPI